VTVSTLATMAATDLAGHVERSRLISAIPWVRHGVTRRVPGLGLADGNVGYTAPRDEADAWEMRQRWALAMGIDPSDLVRVRQVHGNAVRIASEADTERGTHPDAGEAPVADAMITADANVALMTLHADCLAMLLVDPMRRVVGAVHAGWRGTVRGLREWQSVRNQFSHVQLAAEHQVRNFFSQLSQPPRELIRLSRLEVRHRYRLSRSPRVQCRRW